MRSLTKEKAQELGIEFASTRLEAIKEADFVVLGMALTKETRGIFGKEEIDGMKINSYYTYNHNNYQDKYYIQAFRTKTDFSPCDPRQKQRVWGRG